MGGTSLNPKRLFNLLKQTFTEWSEDKAPMFAAALAYYTIFSLAPLLVIIVGILGIIYGQSDAKGQIIDQIGGLTSPNVAETIKGVLDAQAESGGGVLATVLGTITLLVGATGVFAQLQTALNTIWEVKPNPDKGGVLHLLMVRLLSLGMVLVIAFLLLVSLLLSTALEVVGAYFTDVLPGADFIWQIVNIVVSFGVITLLFALIFKYLPDVKISWGDVWIGAAVTSLLFVIGKFLISWYLSRGGVASTYGAAGSLVILLLWIYYSAQILFFGAEFTQVYAKEEGSRIVPSKDAVRAEM